MGGKRENTRENRQATVTLKNESISCRKIAQKLKIPVVLVANTIRGRQKQGRMLTRKELEDHDQPQNQWRGVYKSHQSR